jgi:hypothetical protein
MDRKDAARLLAVGRIVIGALIFLFPSTFVQLWTGRRNEKYPTNMLARGLAARDVALGVGTLIALEGSSASRWLQACAVADAGDAVGTLTSMRELGGLKATGLLAVEVGAAAVGLALAEEIDD